MLVISLVSFAPKVRHTRSLSRGMLGHTDKHRPLLPFLPSVVCIIRVWSIHKRSKAVLALLSLSLTGMLIVQTISIVHYSHRWRDADGTCIVSSDRMWIAAFWIAPAALDTITLALSIAAVVVETRRYGYNRLLTIILRDQVAYFVVVAATYLTTAITRASHAPLLESLHNPAAVVISSIAATRIVLSFKAQGDSSALLHQHHQGASGGGGGNMGSRYMMSSHGDSIGASRGITIKAGPHEKSWFHIRPKAMSSVGARQRQVDVEMTSSAGSASLSHRAAPAVLSGSPSSKTSLKLGSSPSETDLASVDDSRDTAYTRQLDYVRPTPPRPSTAPTSTPADALLSPSRRLKDIKGRAARGHVAHASSLASQFEFDRQQQHGGNASGRRSPFALTPATTDALTTPSRYDGGAELSEALTGGRASPPPFSSAVPADEADALQIERGPVEELNEEDRYVVASGSSNGNASNANAFPPGVIMFTNDVTTIEEVEDPMTRPSCETITPGTVRTGHS